MGLFGLFASMVGLGAMAKDSISDNIQTQKSYKKAKASGSSIYYGSGSKQYYTDTGRRCYTDYDYCSGHILIRDYDTGDIIEDITDINNKKKYEQQMNELPSYCIFRRQYGTGVWVSDKISGYFAHRPAKYIDRSDYSEVNQFSEFEKGELENRRDIHGRNYITVKTKSSSERYFADGVPYSKAELRRRVSPILRKLNKEKGYKFYPFDFDSSHDYVGERIKAIRPDSIYFSDIRDVDTDEKYVYNYKEKYFSKARMVEYQKNIAEPHHKPIYETRYRVIEDPDAERFNLDGTKWYP